jgi:hypothetical protein
MGAFYEQILLNLKEDDKLRHIAVHQFGPDSREVIQAILKVRAYNPKFHEW